MKNKEFGNQANNKTFQEWEIMTANILRSIILYVLAVFSLSVGAADNYHEDEFIEDAAKVFAFYHSQSLVLEKIKQTYPGLERDATLSQLRFDNRFLDSVENIEAALKKKLGKHWEQFVTSLQELATPNYSASQAEQFVEEVRRRAEGELPREILVPLLVFNEEYSTWPLKEMVQGYSTQHNVQGGSSAKDLVFSIDMPLSWVSKEGVRPNIATKLVSHDGRGLVTLTVLVLNDSGLQGLSDVDFHSASAEELRSMAEEIAPENFEVKGADAVVIDRIPGISMIAQFSERSLTDTMEFEAIIVSLFWGDYFIQIMGGVPTTVNGEALSVGGLSKWEALLRRMIRSFVLHSQYE